MRAYGLAVVEVARPDRSMRRRQGKFDLIDAQAAARATLAGMAVTTPIPASSGRTDRHRLNRGATARPTTPLRRIALVRMRCHPSS